MSLGRFLGGVVVGSALGGLFGLLFAPRPGTETRKLIQSRVKTQCDNTVAQCEDALHAVQHEVDKLGNAVQTQAKTQSEAAITALKDNVAAIQNKLAAVADNLETQGRDVLTHLGQKVGEKAGETVGTLVADKLLDKRPT